MSVKKWLEKVADIVNSDIPGDEDCKIYVTKYDGGYITRVGVEDNIKHLADREITDCLTHGVGYSPKDKKWYGWSHRAIYGFEIGSACKKGDAHYNGSTLEEQEEAAIEFWENEYHLNTHCAGIVKQDEERYFDIKWECGDNTPNEELRNTISGCLHYIKSIGRGEWTAETVEDARQMAIDFNEGVS